MGHHRREDPLDPSQLNENKDIGNNPFLGSSDITYLSMILPLLSDSGKQLISFFVNFGTNKPVNSAANDPFGILKQLAPKIENSGLREILPSLLTLFTNSETKSPSNPLSSNLSNNAPPKEEEDISK